MQSPEELAREKIERFDSLKDWSSSDKTLSKGKARRVSAGSANQFQQFVTPDDGRKFTELYNVQHLKSNRLDPVSRVCITTIHSLYSTPRGDADFEPSLEATLPCMTWEDSSTSQCMSW